MDISISNGLIKVFIQTTSDSFGAPKYIVYPASKLDFYYFTLDEFTISISGILYQGDLNDLTVQGVDVTTYTDADSKLAAVLLIGNTVSGTFTTFDGKTVTVLNGLVITIASNAN